MLVNNNKIDLCEPKKPEEVGHIEYSKYCHYHRIMSHPTKNCFILEDKIHVLVEVKYSI